MRIILLTFMLTALPAVVLAKDLVVVVGGSGKTGIEVVKQLTAKEQYELRATTRNVGRAKANIGDDIDWVYADVKDVSSLRSAIDGADYVISAIGAGAPGGENGPKHIDYQGVVNLVDICQELGVKQFVLTSAIGVGDVDHFLNVLFGNVQVWKWLGEDYIHDSGLPYTIVRPGGLSDGPAGHAGIKLAAKGALHGGEIPRADVAQVLIESIGNPNAIKKTIEIISDEATEVDLWKADFASIKVDPADPPRPARFE